MCKMLWKTQHALGAGNHVWRADGASKALRMAPGTQLALNKYSEQHPPHT